MTIAHVFNIALSDDIEERFNIIECILNRSKITTGNNFSIGPDKFYLFNAIENYRNTLNNVIFFIHHSDASINCVINKFKNNWPSNVFAIFYSGEGVPRQDVNNVYNMKTLSAWFPSEVYEGTYHFKNLVNAVSAAAKGNVDEFTGIDINQTLNYAVN